MQFARDACPLSNARLQGQSELPVQLPDAKLVGRPQQRWKNGRAKRAKPQGVPPRGQYTDVKRNPLLVPDSIIIGGLDVKRVVAVVKVGIGGQTTRGVGVLPVLIEPIEFIGVTVFLWGGEVQRRKLKPKNRLIVAESHV